jgi:photosystem II stability/assembly factor-like uncharacterized protein
MKNGDMFKNANTALFSFIVVMLSLMSASCDDDASPAPVTGWTIGYAQDGNAQTVKLLKTSDGGATWILQTLPAECEGYAGNDISAVDHDVAWAAVGGDSSPDAKQCAILHTDNGGDIWTVQTLPSGMKTQHIKNIKGVSPDEAWAVSLLGDVLHTTDGGASWNVVEVRDVDGNAIPVQEINRMDVLGLDIWIVDIKGGEKGVIHSSNGGITWRQEQMSGMCSLSTGPIVVSAVSSLVTWAAMNKDGYLWWTSTGGNSWTKSNDTLVANADYDDICASSANVIWIAFNGTLTGGGFTARVTVTDGNFETNQTNHPPYMLEGISPMTDTMAWAVGQRMPSIRPDLPMSAIYFTEDGGVTWLSQTMPTNALDVTLWKVSFVGARR